MIATPTMLALVQEYLAFRRTLGFALGTAGQELLLFARYADRTGHRGPVTTQATPAYWAWRLQAVRLFAQHQAVEDPRTEVPPPGLLGPTFRRAQPHIYSTDEVAALLRAARTLRRRTRPHTCVALFGLLASTGLRIGEALALGRDHVDLEAASSASSRARPVSPGSCRSMSRPPRRCAAMRPRGIAFTLTHGPLPSFSRIGGRP